VGKKKATGMSKRLGFTDRATIAENKDILRYNERLEREAKGLPAEAERRSGPRRSSSERGSSEGSRPRQDRPARAPRPVRPPALDDEQKVLLQAALDAAVGETGMEEAGQAVITRLAEHDSFDKASSAGWAIASGGHASERTPAEWDLLRQVWLSIRIALLEAYVTFKPDLEPTLARERKQVARISRTSPQRKRRGKRPATKAPGAGRPAGARGGPPSPADVARHIGKAVEPAVVTGTATETVAEVAPDAPGVEAPSVDEPSVDEASVEPSVDEASVEPSVDEPSVDEASVEPSVDEPSVAEQKAAAAELRAEHAPDEAVESSDDVNRDQLTLEI
jgi:hypothetical protein